MIRAYYTINHRDSIKLENLNSPYSRRTRVLLHNFSLFFFYLNCSRCTFSRFLVNVFSSIRVYACERVSLFFLFSIKTTRDTRSRVHATFRLGAPVRRCVTRVARMCCSCIHINIYVYLSICIYFVNHIFIFIR